MAESASRRPTVEELAAKLGNEEGHAIQVAALALKLFDATHALFGVAQRERSVLEAAARLHDSAYRFNPRRHAEVAGRYILGRGLKGFSPGQIRKIATVIRLHSAPLGFAAARAQTKRTPEAQLVLYLATLLRIADGLDYGHLQDAVIVSGRGTKRQIRFVVRSALCPFNLERARRQAGLWRQAFPADIDLRPAPARPGRLLDRNLAAAEAARRLLFRHYRALLSNVGGALGPDGGEALHEGRVAIRRMRTVLKAFRRPLRATSAARIESDLQSLNRVLGTVRDLDVWIGFLSEPAVTAQFTGHRLWAGFVAHQIGLRQLQQSTVRRHLQGSGFNSLCFRIERLLRIDLIPSSAVVASAPLAGVARRALARSLSRIFKLGHLRHSGATEKIHRLRIALRRTRYLADFFEGVFGAPVSKLGRRARAVERVLGNIRDAELAHARFISEGPAPPKLLVRQLQRLRENHLPELEGAWRRLVDPAFVSAVRRELK
jgi:CHAD domain-containing protein